MIQMRIAMRRVIVWVPAVVGICICNAAVGEPSAGKPDPLQLLTSVHERTCKLNEFTQLFSKHERIDGKLHEKEVMFLKYRHEPMSIYVKWVRDPFKGREVIYVDGKNDGRALMHEYVGPMNVFLKADPYGREAMKRSCRPITQAGVRNGTEALFRLTQTAANRNELRLFYLGTEYVDKRPVHVLVRLLPKRSEYVAYLTLIYIDKEELIPVKVAGYDWDYTLLWTYASWGLNTTVHLTDKDFDTANEEYDFPGLIPVGLSKKMWPFK